MFSRPRKFVNLTNETPPAVRAHVRLLTLISESDRHGNTSTFDPWPLAECEVNLTRENFKEYLRRDKQFRAAQVAYTGSFMRDPSQQSFAAQRCLKLRPDIERGDGGAVLEAIATCASHGLVIPAWLAAAFVDRYQRVATGECRSWTDAKAFGAALPKGQNVKGLRARKHFGPWAYEVALALLENDPTRPIDSGFYEAVAEKLGFKSKSRVQQLIAEYIKYWDGSFPPLKYVRKKLQSTPDLVAVLSGWSVQRRADSERRFHPEK